MNIGLLTILLLMPPEGDIRLSLSHKVAIAPAYGTVTVRVDWQIERHPLNGAYLLQWVSENYDGTTGNSMNGVNEPKIYSRFVDLPSGNYTFRLCVWSYKRRCVDRYLEVK